MSFDAVAPWYRTLETITFGNALQRARVAFLDEIGFCKRALIVGEGNGRFLAALLERHPLIKIDCVDNSKRMLDLARDYVLDRQPDAIGRVTFRRQDVRSWMPNDRYDLIVTHFFLDCFPTQQLGLIVARLAEAAAPAAIWLLADFDVPDGAFARIRAQTWLAAMYLFFRATARIEAKQLIDPSPFLRAGGFVLEQSVLFRGGIVKSQSWRRQLL